MTESGWVTLTQYGTNLPVTVWVIDVEMVADHADGGCTVYLHHDKMRVNESREFVLAWHEKVNDAFEAAEARK